MRVSAAAAAALLIACGGAVPAGPAPRAPGSRPAAAWLAGSWRWTMASEEAGVRRVEIEDWDLVADGAAVSGSCSRQVVFLALDGVPFRCSQSLGYRLLTRYRVRGAADRGGAWLDEVGHEAAPSPCDSGQRARARYRAARRVGALELRWPGGRQILRRATAAAPPIAGVSGPSGRWQWRNRVELLRREVRVELESWRLAEAKDGRIAGTYERRVTVFNEDGRVYACSGESSYQYEDRYDVRGWRDRDRLQLSEVAAHPGDPACTGGVARILDSAEGTIYRDAIELEWRGRNRQVLSRAGEDAPRP